VGVVGLIPRHPHTPPHPHPPRFNTNEAATSSTRKNPEGLANAITKMEPKARRYRPRRRAVVEARQEDLA
jgi:hypothetical protein